MRRDERIEVSSRPGKAGRALIIILVLSSAAAFLQVSGSEQCTVKGRFGINNPKLKLRGGETDASGVAVWLIPLSSETKAQPAGFRRVRIEQRDKRFIPHVTLIQIGTEVDFPNHDPFFHNVFSTFEGKTFDLGLYANGESRPVVFNRPGISYLYCNIHPQMSAVIITVDTPYFATSAQDGSFSINGLTTGSYELRVWHERSDPRLLESLRSVLSVHSSVVDIGTRWLDEAGYIPKRHKNKHGEDYVGERESSPYRRR